MWLQNIESSPSDRATSQVSVNTPAYSREVGTVAGVETLMMALGFTLSESCWEFTETKVPALREGLRVLTEELARQRPAEPPVSKAEGMSIVTAPEESKAAPS